jgi:hypothetical protein
MTDDGGQPKDWGFCIIFPSFRPMLAQTFSNSSFLSRSRKAQGARRKAHCAVPVAERSVRRRNQTREITHLKGMAGVIVDQQSHFSNNLPCIRFPPPQNYRLAAATLTA